MKGYSTPTGSSAECLELVSNSRPSLLILDIWLKDSNMDGIDIYKKSQNRFSSSARGYYLRSW